MGESDLNMTAMEAAYERIKKSDFVIRTPIWKDCLKRFHKVLPHVGGKTRLHLKLENCQIGGSFKTRGVVNQVGSMNRVPSVPTLVTMSAGNYGKAFACVLKQNGIDGHVVMPNSVPPERVSLIRYLGCQVEQVDVSLLQETVNKRVAEDGMKFLHSYDDIDLIAGHASLGLEILEDCQPEIVVVCCGGGGLLAGVAAALKSKYPNCTVYGVEPEGAPTMHKSFEKGEPFSLPSVKSIASGLSPPYAGKKCYHICSKFVKNILLVSDDDLKEGVRILYEAGIVAEPAGAAAFTALLKNKIPNVDGKEICVVITGSNMSPPQLLELTGCELFLKMDSEIVYQALLTLFTKRAFLEEWRIIVESDYRIILEKRLAFPFRKSHRDSDSLAEFAERDDLNLFHLDVKPLPESETRPDSRLDSLLEPIVKREKVDANDSGVEWSGSSPDGDVIVPNLEILDPDEEAPSTEIAEESEINSPEPLSPTGQSMLEKPKLIKKTSRTKKVLKRSIKRIVKKECPLCKTSNYGNKYLRTHIKRCHPEFLTEDEKREEADRELSERTCTICAKVFVTKGGLTVHMKEIHLRDSIDDRTCPHCLKVLSSKRRREEHIATLHDEGRVGGPFPCDYCGKPFGTKDKLRIHKQRMCPENRTAAICSVCGRTYVNPKSLRLHLLQEHPEDYKPENDSDRRLLNLKTACYICGKEMRRMSLKHHIAHVHQQIQRTFGCKICQEKFTSFSLYNAHLKEVHRHVPKRKACGTCGKTFSTCHSLRNHERGVHLGIRYQCELCPSSFFSKKDRKDHVNSVHLGNKHQCPECPREFNRRSELNRHKRNVHNINTTPTVS